jgi:hypothetical protein
MKELIAQAGELQSFLESKGWDFYFVGGIAVQIWGEPRLTRDIDLTVFTNLSDETKYLRAFLTKFKSRFSDSSEAEQFAKTKRVLLLETENGIGIDLMWEGWLPGIPHSSAPVTKTSPLKYA